MNLSRNPSSTFTIRIATSELLADHDRIIFPKWYAISSLCTGLHGVLTTIHRKCFYHNFILINLTFILSLVSHVYIMLAQA